MKQKIVVIAINSSWNIVNFRTGLIKGLQRSGYQVIALAPPDRYSEKFSALGVNFIPIAMDKQGTSPFNDIALIWRYYRTLRKLKPDALLTYTIKPNIYGSIASSLLMIPTINNVAGLGTAFINKGIITKLVAHLYRLSFRRSKTIFFQNPDDMNLFVEKSIVRHEQKRLLPGSGIDLEKFRPLSESEGTGSGITFLLVARLLWDKGVGEYVGAAHRVRKIFPDARFQLLGVVDAENRTAIGREQVDRWATEDGIEYLGAADDVRPFIAAADCVVLPSYREGLPRALLEGAAMAKPLIATDVPGCRQLIEDGRNGYLCTVRDSASLADAMLRLMEQPVETRRAMGRAGRKLVESAYREEIPVARYIEAIADALGVPATEDAPGR